MNIRLNICMYMYKYMCTGTNNTQDFPNTDALRHKEMLCPYSSRRI